VLVASWPTYKYIDIRHFYLHANYTYGRHLDMLESTANIVLTVLGLVVALIGIVGAAVTFRRRRYDVVRPLARSAKHKASRISFFIEHYGLTGIALWCFASREVWQIQLQVVRSIDDGDVTNYKKSAQEDSNIIAVAVSLFSSFYTSCAADPTSGNHHRPDRHHCTFIG